MADLALLCRLEDHAREIPGAHGEPRTDVAVVLLERDRPGEVERQRRRLEHRVGAVDLRLVGLAPVVEPRPDLGLEIQLAPDAAHRAGQAVVVGDDARLLDRHEVDHLGDALRRQEPRDEDSRVGEVHLLCHAVVDGVKGEVATLPVVEQRGEDARRVEAGAAEPVHGAVRGDERCRLQVADQTVVGDGGIAARHRDDLLRAAAGPTLRGREADVITRMG